ncbi:uncharacterized protein LOC124946072 [Impatiens glandulifera]|uniref:uncharacterized protein LOC124946072 n=1 Tax=Impatiens glandulifera TaxID=253017 RepID=UPI001FB0F6F2|nr:uncharacterized protein LOC124946072 [Impatiens glandulifera]
MAPHGESVLSSAYVAPSKNFKSVKPPSLSTTDCGGGSLRRTLSDMVGGSRTDLICETLPVISEVETAKCECCGMCEEYTPEYIERVKAKFFMKWICGLCAEAVKEEVEKNGGDKEKALKDHISACVRFNKFGRAFPVLCQAEAMREMLKKSSCRVRTKSVSPRDHKTRMKSGGIARSSSCMPSLTREINDLTISN